MSLFYDVLAEPYRDCTCRSSMATVCRAPARDHSCRSSTVSIWRAVAYAQLSRDGLPLRRPVACRHILPDVREGAACLRIRKHRHRGSLMELRGRTPPFEVEKAAKMRSGLHRWYYQLQVRRLKTLMHPWGVCASLFSVSDCQTAFALA